MRKLVLSALALSAAACSGDPTVAPVAAAATASTAPMAAANFGSGKYPGSSRTDDAEAGKFTPLNCVPKSSAEGSAVIGPAGGTLHIGTHRLVVPAGALTENVLISGTVPADKPFEIDLQPHGLRFLKAAGLRLDASSCTDVPTIVYVVDQLTVGSPIEATYSNWWKTIACPIWHFSGYMIALGVEESGEVGTR